MAPQDKAKVTEALKLASRTSYSETNQDLYEEALAIMEADTDAQDAARYRWFAGVATSGDFDRAEAAFACFDEAEDCTKEELDAAIDAAIEKSK